MDVKFYDHLSEKYFKNIENDFSNNYERIEALFGDGSSQLFLQYLTASGTSHSIFSAMVNYLYL